ncbi:hypothetical protein AB3N59_14720 [Leptospira sp. WS92.C1]
MIGKIDFILLSFVLLNCASWERVTSPQRWGWIGSANYKSTQTFVIDPKQDSQIEAEEGTQIQFPSGSLIGTDGSLITSPVRIEISEYYKGGDILLSGLSTASAGKPIQTKGMVFLNAYSESGTKAQVNPKNPPKISFASPIEQGYEVFYGVKTSDGNLDWSTETSKQKSISNHGNVSFLPSLAKNQAATKSTNMRYMIGMEGGPESVRNNVKPPAVFLPLLSLGWINCDRFLYMGIKLIPLNVEAPYPVLEEETWYYLILPSIRSVMPAYSDANKRVSFPNLPPNEKAILYGLRKSGATRWQLWIREVKIGQEEKLIPEWELVGPKALEKRVQSLAF